jgi:hypothetical protein
VPERYELQRMLWDLRHDDAVAALSQRDLGSVLGAYRLRPEEAQAVLDHDFATLLAMGVNPLLLFFGALRMGVTRNDYYARLRSGEGVTGVPGTPSVAPAGSAS